MNVKPEFIRFEFPLVGEPTRDPEATWARAMDASKWSRTRRVWGIPVIESDACPHGSAFLMDPAWVKRNFAFVDGRLMVVGGLAAAMFKAEGKDGDGTYARHPDEELC